MGEAATGGVDTEQAGGGGVGRLQSMGWPVGRSGPAGCSRGVFYNCMCLVHSEANVLAFDPLRGIYPERSQRAQGTLLGFGPWESVEEGGEKARLKTEGGRLKVKKGI